MFFPVEYSQLSNTVNCKSELTNLGDAKTAMKQAKKANGQAKDVKNEKDDENDNIKPIQKLN